MSLEMDSQLQEFASIKNLQNITYYPALHGICPWKREQFDGRTELNKFARNIFKMVKIMDFICLI